MRIGGRSLCLIGSRVLTPAEYLCEFTSRLVKQRGLRVYDDSMTEPLCILAIFIRKLAFMA
jgi:hypothetical protein